MPTTGYYDFENVTQHIASGRDNIWSNLSNILDGGTGVATSTQTLDGDSCRDLHFYNWAGRAQVPDNAVIDSVTIRGNGTCTDFNGFVYDFNVGAGDGGNSTGDWPPSSTITYSGSGLTAQERYDLVKNSSSSSDYAEFFGTHYGSLGSFNETITLSTFEMTVTWSYPPSTAILLAK